jgi:hypothetical protein
VVYSTPLERLWEGKRLSEGELTLRYTGAGGAAMEGSGVYELCSAARRRSWPEGSGSSAHH